MVSRDGKTVAFIAGMMSDFGSTGGDVFRGKLDGGAAVDITPAMQASGTTLAWSCDGSCALSCSRATAQIVDLVPGARPATPRVLWSGTKPCIGDVSRGISVACPSGPSAVAP